MASTSDGSPEGLQGLFHAVDVTHARRTLSALHARIVDGAGRVEIRRRGCDGTCVIISRAELEALERALEILSETAGYNDMCKTLTELATACMDGCDTIPPPEQEPVNSAGV